MQCAPARLTFTVYQTTELQFHVDPLVKHFQHININYSDVIWICLTSDTLFSIFTAMKERVLRQAYVVVSHRSCIVYLWAHCHASVSSSCSLGILQCSWTHFTLTPFFLPHCFSCYSYCSLNTCMPSYLM